MCTCPPHTPVLYWMADPLEELGKVRTLQDRESHAGCEALSSAAFEYEFGALERLDNPVTETYLNLMYVSGLVHHAFSNLGRTYRDSALGTKMPPVQIFVADAGQYLPYGAVTWLFEKDDRPGSVKIRENRKQAHAVARKLIDAKRENILNGEQGKDVLSLLSKL
jgi:hypothetical protein